MGTENTRIGKIVLERNSKNCQFSSLEQTKIERSTGQDKGKNLVLEQ